MKEFTAIPVDGPEEFYCLLIETPTGNLIYINKKHIEDPPTAAVIYHKNGSEVELSSEAIRSFAAVL